MAFTYHSSLRGMKKGYTRLLPMACAKTVHPPHPWVKSELFWGTLYTFIGELKNAYEGAQNSMRIPSLPCSVGCAKTWILWSLL